MKKTLNSYAVNAASVVALFVVLLVMINTKVINSYNSGILLMVGINIILAASLNLSTGFLGQLVLGHAGFMSVGAYAAALFTLRVPMPDAIKFPVALIFGGLVAAVFGIIIGIPALRLRGDYLAIITLGFGEIIRVLILFFDFTGGGQGLKNIPELTDFTYVYWVVVIVIAGLYMLVRSRQGRAIVAIREDEIATEASGVNTTYYKLLGFTISAFCAGLAGGLYAHYITVLDPSNFGFMRSVEILVMVVLGGMGSFTGSILAAAVLTIIPEALRAFSDYRLLIYSFLLILMMIFKPGGLLGRYEFSLTGTYYQIKAFIGKLLSKKRPGKGE